MSNSSLVSYVRRSPNYDAGPFKKVGVAIHCVAGNSSLEYLGNRFADPDLEASSNYGIDSKGTIALFVDEVNSSYCTSSQEIDQQVVTIEVANNGGADAGWPVSEAAYASLINLLVDICKRNGIKELLWQANPDLIGEWDQQNMVVHRWLAAKACPGDYLFNKHYEIAAEVNKRLSEEDDDMTKVIEQIAKNTGLTEDQVIGRLTLMVGFQDVELDEYQTAGVNKLKELGFISTARDGRAQVNWGDLGTVVGRLYEKTK